MGDAVSEQDAEVSRPRPVILVLHGAQLVIAVTIMGLNAYGAQYVSYNTLIFSLTVTICTSFVCTYIIVSRSCCPKLYSPYVVLAYHFGLIMFWIIGLALLANLAYLWEGPDCVYDFAHGVVCSPNEKRHVRSISKRLTVTYGVYYGCLVAAAILAAFEVALWITTTTLMFLDRHRHYVFSTARPTTASPVNIENHELTEPTQSISLIPSQTSWTFPPPNTAHTPNSSPPRAQPDPVLPPSPKEDRSKHEPLKDDASKPDRQNEDHPKDNRHNDHSPSPMSIRSTRTLKEVLSETNPAYSSPIDFAHAPKLQDGSNNGIPEALRPGKSGKRRKTVPSPVVEGEGAGLEGRRRQTVPSPPKEDMRIVEEGEGVGEKSLGNLDEGEGKGEDVGQAEGDRKE